MRSTKVADNQWVVAILLGPGRVPLTQVHLGRRATVYDARAEVERDRGDVPGIPAAFHFVSPTTGAPLPQRHEAARPLSTIVDKSGAVLITDDARHPGAAAVPPAAAHRFFQMPAGVDQPQGPAQEQGQAVVHAQVAQAQAPAPEYTVAAQAYTTPAVATPPPATAQLTPAQESKAGAASTSSAAAQQPYGEEQKPSGAPAPAVKPMVQHEVTAGWSHGSFDGDDAPPPSVSATASSAAGPGGAAAALAYATDGGGRLPHPTIPLRQGQEAHVLASLEGVFTVNTKAKGGVFPSTRHTAIIAAPNGPRASGPGFGHPTAPNVDPTWWNTADPAHKGNTCAPYDDLGEANLQERVLRTVFPRLFLDAYSQKTLRKHPPEGPYAWSATNFILGMCEGSTAGRHLLGNYAASFEGSYSIYEACLRAVDHKHDLDKRLRKAGLDDNLWLPTLDAKKQASVRDALLLHQGRHADSGSASGHYTRFLKNLRNMPVGALAMRGAGWASDDGGHCVVNVVEKTSKTTFSMTMCNSGMGLGNHAGVPLYNCPGPIGNYALGGRTITAMRVDHFDLNDPKVKDLGNLHYFHRCDQFRDRLNPCMNYRVGMPLMIGKTLRRAVRDSPDLQGWPSTGQRGDTCGYRGPVKAFQYVLRRYGFSKADIKEVTLAQRLFYVAKVGEELAEIRAAAHNVDAPLSVSSVVNAGYQGRGWTGCGFLGPAPDEMLRTLGKTEYLVIDDACHRLCTAALKTHDRGRVSDGMLRMCIAVARRVRQLLPRASAYWFPLPASLPPFDHQTASMAGVAGTVSHQQPLELLVDWPDFDIDARAGPLDTGEFPATLDAAGVLARLHSAQTLQEAVPALGAVAQLVRHVRGRFERQGHVAVSKLHVVGLRNVVVCANACPRKLPAQHQYQRLFCSTFFSWRLT